MGTTIQANGFLREYHSVIDLDGSHGNHVVENGCQNPDSFTPSTRGNGHLRSDLEKVRETILEHESIFRSQLRELHRLYRRQKELMNEIKRREISRVGVKEVKSQSSLLFSPGLPHDTKRIWNAPSMTGCSSASGSSSKSFATFLEGKVVPNFTPLQDTRILTSCEPWMSSKSSICRNGMYGLRIQADMCSGNVADQDIKLSLGAVQKSQCNAETMTFDLYSKRQNTAGDVCIIDGTPDCLALGRGLPANSSLPFNLGMKDFFEKSRNNHGPENYAEKMTFDKLPSSGDLRSGKSPAFPQLPPAEQRREFSQRKRKLFGVEIEGYSNPSDTACKTVSSSWIDESFAENLELGRVNSNGSKMETLKAASKGVNEIRPHRCSAIGLVLDNDLGKCLPAEVLKKDPETFGKCRPPVPRHHTALTDSHKNQENLKSGLPWFLRNSQGSSDPGKGKQSPYFMNLDSLKNCSQNFFRKSETAYVLEKEMINEKRSGATKILGIPIADMLPGFENQSPGGNPVEVSSSGAEKFRKDENKDVLQIGLNNYIDLNLSLDDEEASPSAPTLPTTIVKIATTEIDLEAPAVIESETETASSLGKECDKIAAEVLFTISLHGNSVDDEPPEAASVGCLEWFAEIVSFRCVGTTANEESIPTGMDYFEYMTLKLEDQTKEEQYHYETIVLSQPADDETGNAALLKRSRRRGRQRKDFQRDMLPGMITLSRLEVAEDLQAFDELLKWEGGGGSSSSSSRTSARLGRGRKRAAAGPGPTRTQPAYCQMEDKSLTGWGKRTRRLPRQRCHNAFISFPVKC